MDRYHGNTMAFFEISLDELQLGKKCTDKYHDIITMFFYDIYHVNTVFCMFLYNVTFSL